MAACWGGWIGLSRIHPCLFRDSVARKWPQWRLEVLYCSPSGAMHSVLPARIWSRQLGTGPLSRHTGPIAGGAAARPPRATQARRNAFAIHYWNAIDDGCGAGPRSRQPRAAPPDAGAGTPEMPDRELGRYRISRRPPPACRARPATRPTTAAVDVAPSECTPGRAAGGPERTLFNQQN